MTTRTPTLPLAATAALLLAQGTAHATFEAFTSATDFAAATSGAVTDDYNDLIAGDVPFSPIARTLGAGGYTASTSDGEVFFIGTDSIAPSGEEYLSHNQVTGQPVIIDGIVGLPATAISGYFSGSSVVPVAANMTVTVVDVDGGSATASIECNVTPDTCFLGFTSTVAIARLEFASDTSFSGVDDLTFADAGNGGGDRQYCITFDNFCDSISVSNGVGQWDWTCDGVTLAEGTQVSLTQNAEAFICDGPTCPFGPGAEEDWSFVLRGAPNGVFNLFNLTQGVQFQFESPYTVVFGQTCPFGGARGVGLPPILDLF